MASKKISQLSSNSTPSLTGVTLFDDGLTTYKTSLSSLRQTLVDSGSHHFTGSQQINGNLSVTGSLRATSFVGDGSGLSNVAQSSGSNNLVGYFSGSNFITGANKMYVLNDGDTISIGKDSRNIDYPERLYVENEHFNIASFVSTLSDGYAEVNIINRSTGSNSSTDLVLWNDYSTESSSFVDLGINSSNYNAGGVGYGGDGYLINAANDLYIGSLASDNHGHVHIYGGNLWQSSSISVYNDGTIGFGTDVIDNDMTTIPSSTQGYTYEFYGDVKINDKLSVESLFHVGAVSEKVTPYNATNSITHSLSQSAISYLTNLSSDFNVNLIDIFSDNNNAQGFTIIVEQGSTPYKINELRIQNQLQSITWVGGSMPSRVPNTTNVFSFSILRINSNWKVFGQLTTF